MNDDGSGTALTIELARVFSQSGIDFDATLVFMCHVGEEQGLVGARLHAQKAVAEKIPIEAVFNNDIVGGDRRRQRDRRRRDDPRLLGRPGGFAVARAGAVRPALGRPLRAVAQGAADGAAGSLRPRRRSFGVQRARFHRGRLPRIARELHAAARRARYLRGISLPYLAQNARVNAAAAATLALAPPPPGVLSERNQPLITRAPTGYDANLNWNAAPGAAAYRIFWREAWGHGLAAGRARRQRHDALLPNMQIDDYVFGVAAIDAGGHESFVTAYVTPPRAARKRYQIGTNA